MIRNLLQWLERAEPVVKSVGSIRRVNTGAVDNIVAMHAGSS